MRIKLTPVQIDTLREYLPQWCETADIVLGKSYADIEDHDVAEVYAAFDDVLSSKAAPSAVAWRVHAALRAAMPVNGAELPAEPPNEGGEGEGPAVDPEPVTGRMRVVTPPPELPHPVMMAAAAIARGEYGPEAKRLTESMDDRQGERQTRWLARLRHKLISAGEVEAANAIRIVPAI